MRVRVAGDGYSKTVGIPANRVNVARMQSGCPNQKILLPDLPEIGNPD
ncbi:MAG: hypothetical protein KDA77_21435 [Planctomycetaceae bacterium]|nr:hypothetical protein [Planctomycetaceae bacterium]